MNPELDESLSRFHAAIVSGAKGEEATRAMPPLSGTINAPVEYLDLATVIKVSQAVSGEIVQEKQLEILMRTAIEQAGAERGVLVLSRWTEPRIAAQATTGDGGIVVKLHDEAMTPAVLPESVIQYVVRTNESVILDDAAAQNPFSADPYIQQQHARSILCLPFLNQGQLIGVLYLENNLTPGVFAPARIAVLKLLASQAAISLENARLYRELAEREVKIRQLVEAQTPRAEDELRAIVDNAPVFLWSDLPDGYCDFLNQPWLTYFNLSLEEAQGAGWATLLHPDDAAHHLESWQKSVSTGIPFETEARYRRSDGEYRWFLNRANPLRDKAGRIVKWYGTNIDIENLKRTEARLRQSEAYLAEAQRLSHTGSFGWTPSTGEIHWSDESFRIFEYDQSIQPTIELVLQRIHPDDRAMMRELFDETARGEKDFDVTHRLLMPDGSAKFVHILSHAVKDAAGNLEIIGTLMDVTENTRLYRDLAEREAKIRRLIDANIVGIVFWDLDGGIRDANDAFLRMVGYERVDLVAGRLRWTDLTPAEWHEQDERAVAELRSTGTFQPFEKEYFRKDRSRMPVLIGGALFEESGNEGVAFVLDLTERKRAEEELRRSQHYLAEAQKVSHTGSWAWSPVSNAILYWSEECYRILGYDPAQGLPSFESSFEHIHPEDRSALAETIERAVREKANFQIEYRLVLPDGTRRNVRILSHPVLDASGKLVEFVGTVMDVTEQKRAKQERRAHLWFLESMDRINRAMQQSNDVELMTSGVMQEALEIFACDRVALIYPCDPDTPTYRTVMEHASPEYKGALTLGKDLPVSPEGGELHRRCLHDSGVVVDPILPPATRERFRIASMLAIAVRPKGDRPYMLGVHCERSRPWTAAELRLFKETARRLGDALTSVLAHRNLLASQEELRRSRAYLAEAQKVSHTGSWAWNNVTRENVYWSEECLRIHGRDPTQGPPSLEQILADIHPEDVPGIVASLEKALREDREWEGEYRLVNFADGPRTVRSIAHPVPDRSGRVVEYIGTVVDITEQKRAEQELRTSELQRARAEHALRDAREKLAQASKIASLAELSASIAHEINQPLQAIVANGHASLRWLDATPPNIEKAIRTAKRVVRDGNAAAEVVSRIRALFKHTAPAKVDLDINKLILQVCALMADEIHGNVISLDTSLAQDVPRIKADAVQIQQVIVNLVRNAIEALAATMERPKPLLIRSRRKGNNVVVDVQDHGTGLADLEKIFEPFITTKQTGMGMGLAICRSIIEAHAGRIWVVRNEVRGVTFSFSLPIEASDAT